jgi:hypothetical protein
MQFLLHGYSYYDGNIKRDHVAPQELMSILKCKSATVLQEKGSVLPSVDRGENY